MKPYKQYCEAFTLDKATGLLIQTCKNKAASILNPTLPHHVDMHIMVCAEHQKQLVNASLKVWYEFDPPINSNNSIFRIVINGNDE